MILNSQLLSEFVLIRANSRLVNSQRPKTPKLPIPPILPLVLLSLIPCALMPLCLVLFSPSCLRGHQSIMQNKAKVKIGKINISTARTKAYANEQRTMNHERHSKQTQSNPIPCPYSDLRDTRHEIRDTNLIPPPRSAIRPTWRRAVI